MKRRNEEDGGKDRYRESLREKERDNRGGMEERRERPFASPRPSITITLIFLALKL